MGSPAFILQLLALYPYYHYWEPLRRYSIPLHTTLGALAALLHAVLGRSSGWNGILHAHAGGTNRDLGMPHESHLAAARAASHGREFMIAGYGLAAYGAWRAGVSTPIACAPTISTYSGAGWQLGWAALLLQPFSGLIYAMSIRQSPRRTHTRNSCRTLPSLRL